jgi:hypothetical protein
MNIFTMLAFFLYFLASSEAVRQQSYNSLLNRNASSIMRSSGGNNGKNLFAAMKSPADSLLNFGSKRQEEYPGEGSRSGVTEE